MARMQNQGNVKSTEEAHWSGILDEVVTLPKTLGLEGPNAETNDTCHRLFVGRWG